ncbi:glycosyltransferase family 8 protein [Laetiporus sulphureus 93-53]|uniref:Glycosyltransferase family 8 protein n=1 Tax=Laetiporus sulphureus 93-53 TaxID=1314785 RepID=A0A165CUB8_9APHY|nr:glycosyltransferase family 8 protein [Laetiporus sulphureus 93-53]KZT03448.1 glycosyltransferase family 8 protein [Laetiporus sulphureus 93-53]
MAVDNPLFGSSPAHGSSSLSERWSRINVFRHRPFRLKQLVLLIATFTICCSYAFFSRHESGDQLHSWSAEDDYVPPMPAAHVLKHGHGGLRSPASHARPMQISDGNPLDNPAVSATAEPIVFSFIMFSEDSANEGAILIKSILMYTSKPVEFHIICDEPAKAYLEGRLRLVKQPTHDITVRFYLLSWSAMLARIEREGTITSDHSAGTPGLMKLFIHEILPASVPRVIYIDTDALFISDPALLWDVFSHLKPRTALAIPTHPDQHAPQWNHANRICSCIMLLDLARLRALRLMRSSADPDPAPPALGPQAFEAMYGGPGEDGHFRDVKLGDQGYWWAIVSHRPDVVEHLPLAWEVSSCLMDMYATGLGEDDMSEERQLAMQVHIEDTPEDGRAVLPKMLHFNCLDGTPHYYEWEGWADPTNRLTQRWWPAVQYHVGFKWIWLNAHRPMGTLKIETVETVVFADERASRQAES